MDEEDKDGGNREGEGDVDDDNTQGETPQGENEEEEDDDDDSQVINTNPTPSKHWTRSQQAHQDEEESSLVKEILSDDKKQQKSHMEVQKASKEKELTSSSKDQLSSQGEGSGSISKELDHQDPEKEGGEELTIKEVSFTKLNTMDKVLMKALTEARDLCYQLDNLSVQKVRGAIMGLPNTPTAAQIHKRELFKLGPQEIES